MSTASLSDSADGPTGLNGCVLVTEQRQRIEAEVWLSKFGRPYLPCFFDYSVLPHVLRAIGLRVFEWIALSEVPPHEESLRLLKIACLAKTELWLVGLDRCPSTQCFRQLSAKWRSIEKINRESEQIVQEMKDYLDEILLRRPQVPTLSKRIGRKASTIDIAVFVQQMRDSGIVEWKALFKLWRNEHPNDKRVRTNEDLREVYRRNFGDRARRDQAFLGDIRR